ncbi:hypothetical protein CCR97_25015 [Rhodoplanes elegans]|uniref:Uncharacterized protein n=1 Tax=Rhodoplanes elegans TaxID=29408 RepID=A0A327KHN7_9BRAD|nr:hypothetical protein [Rhodoplanes elegans]MBK5961440.1 hypothetical protein [Rhodoplanes elegans]RAI37674.1 hypothetical protein CH338_15275 [Rhodoplanes elegans]
MASTNRNVFINCPFDAAYRDLFRATIFTVKRSGFQPRCALEVDDASENRLEKICKIIAECRYGVHDISRTSLDRSSRLPRFNMPLELGLFIGAKKFGEDQGAKRCTIFDTERYRYQKFVSDIAGQDIHAHGNDPRRLIVELAGWLRDQSRDTKVPGGRAIAVEFTRFLRWLPTICRRRRLVPDELTFGDLAQLVAAYIAETA